MHPQIRQNEPGQCPLCGMALTPVSNKKSGESSPFVLEITPEAVALSNVQTTKVKSGAGSGKLTLTGKIQANEQLIKTINQSLLVAVTADEKINLLLQILKHIKIYLLKILIIIGLLTMVNQYLDC
jgi:hypothetical protein